jgi:hypothetical protein
MATPTKIEYDVIDSFQKDLKRLLKKFRTLEENLEIAKRDAIELYHLKRIDNRSVFPIPHFCTEEIMVCKIKKFACKALKGRGSKSGIRVIYAFYCQSYRVEFLEIYFEDSTAGKNRLGYNRRYG